MRNAVNADRSIDRLAAGHGNRIVEQDFVGDVGFRGDRLAYRHRAGVIIGALAKVLEHVLAAGKSRRRDPVDAFAAHLDQ